MSAQSHEPFALTNVRVFDGNTLLDPGTVVIADGVIGADGMNGGDDVRQIDAGGATLLPGLIDAHVHLGDRETLRRFADHGITTALDMTMWPASAVDALRGQPGLTDIRSACTPATVPGSGHSQIPGFPADALLEGPSDAADFVDGRVKEGADYIKVIADIPGPDQDTLNAVVAAAHDRDRKVVAHATTTVTYRMGLDAGADFLTHAPLDTVPDDELITQLLSRATVVIPTLTMMNGVVEFYRKQGGPAPDYATARASIAALHRAGVPILVGTDANSEPAVPYSPPYGESLHTELALLVEAGLTPVEALRAATVLTAGHFGLTDRGVIAPGKRADLVLVDGDPTVDIAAAGRVQRVWCAGIEHARRSA